MMPEVDIHKLKGELNTSLVENREEAVEKLLSIIDSQTREENFDLLLQLLAPSRQEALAEYRAREVHR